MSSLLEIENDFINKFKELIIENEKLKKENEKIKKQLNFININIKNFEKDNNLPIDHIKALETLNLNNIKADIKLLAKYYLDDTDYDEQCIQIVSTHKLKYWRNSKWNIDLHGTIISDVLSSNLYELYLKVNNYDNNGKLTVYLALVGESNPVLSGTGSIIRVHFLSLKRGTTEIEFGDECYFRKADNTEIPIVNKVKSLVEIE